MKDIREVANSRGRFQFIVGRCCINSYSLAFKRVI